MKSHISPLILLLICVNNFAQVNIVKALNSIDKSINALVDDSQLSNASVSFYVYDITNSNVISQFNSKMSLVTASTMKLVTTATALEILGSYHKFKTTIEYDGKLDTLTGVLNGNIYIKGGGDPTLGSKYYTKDTVDIMADWVAAIKNLGIKKVKGSVIGDASYFSDEFVPPTWGWSDMGNYYGAGVSGLSIYDNILKIWFDCGPNTNDTTRVSCYEPYTPDIIIDNRVKTGNIVGDEAYMYGAPYDNYRVVRGRLPKGAIDFEVRGAIHEPDFVAAYEFQHKLTQSGIEFENVATTSRRLQLTGKYESKKRTEVYNTLSPALSSIVYWTNLISNNLFAEHLLKHIGIAQYKDGSVYSSTIAVEKFWRSKGIEMTGFYMNDGSGLSRANAICAEHLTAILVYMKTKSKYWGSFESSLPIAGKTGTMSSLGKGTKIQGNMRAKSGTMTRVKSYAGYVKSASGKDLAYAIIINNFNCTTQEMTKKIEKVMIALGNYNE